ncbi:class I SAM-dependent methyltransferase [Thermodesulfobacteriota bacterium]
MIRTNHKSTIAVCPSTTDQFKWAQKLAKELKIPLTLKESKEFQFLLVCSADGLALKQTEKKGPGPVTVNFTEPTMEYRLKHGGGRTQALARAIGLKKGWQPSVIDATAGLGRDGFIMAHLGCHVHMLERSPILAVMLEDGLERAKQAAQTAEIVSRIKLTQTDSKEFLQKLKQQDRPDVIYLDPMFPERTKSSLVKKEMRILRGLAGDDLDAEKLLDIALGCAGNRVVVKRPRLAPLLGDIAPSHAIKGKTSRFDVYLV